MAAPERDDRPRAKVFWTGRSQAIRLPKEFRFDVDAVLIRREGDRVILEPDHDWPEGYREWLLSGPHQPGSLQLPKRGPLRNLDYLFKDYAVPRRHRRR